MAIDIAKMAATEPRVIVSAQELRGWLPGRVQSADFQCLGCPAPVIPRSYLPSNQKQAHFATKRKGPDCSGRHLECDLFDDVAAAPDSDAPATATRRNITWPIRLVLDEPRKVRGEDIDGLLPGDDQRETTRRQAGGDGGDFGSSAATARTIRTFAAAYRDMTTAQRRDTTVVLPGVDDANRYQYAFKQLPQWQVIELPRRRVFHGPLRWTGEVVDADDTFRIELFAGRGYSKATKRFDAPWTVIVNHRAWSARQRELLVDEVESAASDATSQRDNSPYVYVLADQNRERPNELLVEHRNLVTIFAD